MRKTISITLIVFSVILFSSTESFAIFGFFKGWPGNTEKSEVIKKEKKEGFFKGWPGNTKKSKIDKKKAKKTVKKIKNINSENDTELNFYVGKFDFSDLNRSSRLYGVQHKSEDLYRDTFIGKISPITGGFITQAGASYIYTGVQAEYQIGRINFTPSFTPGYYTVGDGKDLGLPLEFKTEVQMTLDLFKDSHLGMSYNHLSNAQLGDKNPGANSYMLNYIQKF